MEAWRWSCRSHSIIVSWASWGGTARQPRLRNLTCGRIQHGTRNHNASCTRQGPNEHDQPETRFWLTIDEDGRAPRTASSFAGRDSYAALKMAPAGISPVSV